jgi:RNA polymerase sigma-70 factor (ECF subfamily)
MRSSESHDASFARETLQWFDDVYRFAYALTRNRAGAEDLLQETYLRAYRSWHTFIPGSNALTWLFWICRHSHSERTAPRGQVATVSEAIDRLPEPYRSTIVLVDVEDQSYASAATICRVPVGTIRSRLFRARRLIRDMTTHTCTSSPQETPS